MDKNSVAQPAKTYFGCILKYSSYYILHVADKKLNILLCTCVSAYMNAYVRIYVVCLHDHEYVYVCVS